MQKHLSVQRRTRLVGRSARGQHISEFGAAVCLLFLVFVLPLVDLSVLPVRWFISQEFISNCVKKLALSENFSQALGAFSDEPSVGTQLRAIGGVNLRGLRCNLIITKVGTGERFVTTAPKKVPVEWLPNGSKCPCNYAIHVSADVDISPLFLVNTFGNALPGLNAPVPLAISAEANWENLGRDPRTQEFYLNE